MAKITFLKANQTIEIPSHTDFLAFYRINPSLPINFGCTQGQCATCMIKIQSGHNNLSPISKVEKETLKKFENGCRLACQCEVFGDVVIE